MIKRLSVIFLTCAALSACGFHLRGKLPLADSIKVITVKSEETNETQLRQRVEEALKFAGIHSAKEYAAAVAAITLAGEYNFSTLHIKEKMYTGR